jgi:hypothetical protein
MKTRSLRYRGVLWVILALIAAGSPALAAPSAKLWPRWVKHQAASKTAIEHAAWQRFLKTYVRVSADGINRVAYAGVSAADKRALKAYLAQMSNVRISTYNRREQLAYWINVYNAVTINLILDRWPVRTIRQINISPGVFSRGPWGKKLFTVEGVPVSLDDIEHRILRPVWRDPRIHYAVNCAALGCPNLLRSAFTGANANAQLEAAARDYVNHPRGVTITQGRLRVSNIYRWFKEDFGGSDAGVIKHLKRYARPKLHAQLERISGIAEGTYDWSINEAAGS